MYGDNVALMGLMPFLITQGVVPFFIVMQKGQIEKHLRQRGYNYVVIKHPYNMYPLSASFRGYLHEIFCQLRVLKRIQALRNGIKVIKSFEPDIIHTNTSTNLFGYILARICKIPHVMHLREYMRLDHNFEYIPSKSFFNNLLKWNMNYNIAITPDINEYFLNLKNTTTIYDGVISNKLVPDINSQKKENQILFVGRLCDTKGVKDAISSFCKAGTKKHKLLIAGTGDDLYIRELKQITKNFNKEDNVIFLGYHSDVYELMQKSKAIIVASRFEAFGFITAEAMYNGCIVIGKNTAGTKLQFDNGILETKNEIGFRYTTLVELTEAIQSVCDSDYYIFNNMRSLAQATVLNLYTKENSAKKVFDFYNAILTV